MLAAAVPIKHRQSLVRSVSTASSSARHLYIPDPGASGMAGVTTLALVVGCNHVFEETYCQILNPKHMLTEKKTAGRQPHRYRITSPCWVSQLCHCSPNALLSPPPPNGVRSPARSCRPVGFSFFFLHLNTCTSDPCF